MSHLDQLHQVENWSTPAPGDRHYGLIKRIYHVTINKRLTHKQKAAREQLNPGASQIIRDFETEIRRIQCDLFKEGPSTKDGAARNSTEKQDEPKVPTSHRRQIAADTGSKK